MGVLEDGPGSFEKDVETIEKWSAATNKDYEKKLKPAPAGRTLRNCSGQCLRD